MPLGPTLHPLLLQQSHLQPEHPLPFAVHAVVIICSIERTVLMGGKRRTSFRVPAHDADARGDNALRPESLTVACAPPLLLLRLHRRPRAADVDAAADDPAAECERDQDQERADGDHHPHVAQRGWKSTAASCAFSCFAASKPSASTASALRLRISSSSACCVSVSRDPQFVVVGAVRGGGCSSDQHLTLVSHGPFGLALVAPLAALPLVRQGLTRVARFAAAGTPGLRLRI